MPAVSLSRFKDQRIRMSVGDSAIIYDRKASDMKSEKCGCLNKTCTMTTLVDGPTLDKDLWLLREAESVFSRDESPR